ncbi:MAG: META domain-containing protein [Jatrophihabitantaceae bacterium]
MGTDGATDLDAAMVDRLARAGDRWRAANGAAAEVDFAALGVGALDVGGGDEPFDVLATPAADAPTPRRRRRLWLAASVGVAAAVAAAVLVVQFGGTPGDGVPDPAIGGSGTQLIGTDWTLSAIELGTQSITPAGAAALRIDGGQLGGNDGCNHFGGTVTVSAKTLTIGDLAFTAMGCLDPSVTRTSNAVHAIATGAVGWSISDDTLTITKTGTGSLTYQAVRHTTTTDPKALVGVDWLLGSVIEGNTAHSVGVASGRRSPDLRFDGKGHFRGFDGCNGFSGNATFPSPGRLNLAMTIETTVLCSGSLMVNKIMVSGDTWSITDNQLTITKSGVGALVYTPDIDPGFTGSSGSPSGLPSATSTK